MTLEKQKIIIIDIKNLKSFVYHNNFDLNETNVYSIIFQELHKKLSNIGIIKQYYLTKLTIDDIKTFVIFLELNKNEILSEIFEKYELSKTEEKSITEEFNLLNLYKQSIVFAKEAHGDQIYDKIVKSPYIYHLRQTDKFINYFISEIPYNYVMKLKVAAILHDVLEDTKVKYEELTNIFGKEISDIVLAVTKDAKYNDGGYYSDYEKVYYNQVLDTKYAIYVKMADKCANSRQTTKVFQHKKAEKSLKQYEIFKNIVYNKFNSLIIENCLDSLIKKIKIRNSLE